MKAKARRLYRKLNWYMEDYDCGIEMACNISLNVSTVNRKLDKVLDKLKELDKDYPK